MTAPDSRHPRTGQRHRLPATARRIAAIGLVSASVTLATYGGHAAPAATTTIADIDMAKPFGARSPWRLIATQGPSFDDEIMGKAPGVLRLCLRRVAAGPCSTDLRTMAQPPAPLPPDAWEAHFLDVAKLVYPHGRSSPPLLLVKTGGLLSGDGDQANFTQVLAYRPGADRFVAIYSLATGHNNNQEVRYIMSGPLAGSVISAEPDEHRPYGYRMTVNRLTAAYGYRQALSYLSATRYADDNPLAVIDSEMPNIQRRLGLWRPGSPLPLPAHCPKPRLIHTELWCR